MGCCVSTSDKSNRSSPLKVLEQSRAPPSLEEETVKEVLSETPKWKPTVAKFEGENHTVAKFEGENYTVATFDAEKYTVAKFEAEKTLQKTAVAKFEGESKVEKVMMALESNRGEEEISEVCSLSESVSTTTLTEEEPRQRVHRSPAKINKNRSFSGEFGGSGRRGKSPARRAEQSPVRRNVRVVQSRECQMGNGVTRNQPRRDNSVRRSMSPATHADNVLSRPIVDRSPSARRTNQSPARVRTAASENGSRKRESPAMEQSGNESLENPLVSLECFIFL
ncbi:PREDICTED: uncharacterized protein LOC109345623 isoform X1 [Lupinus angustifolius]|uniref:uncharacterized protein LOC109345623 isoform X1 n=1 Tax=Lupinus angustifolius TaxID=3871 RepID=UPI00092E823B|nr:PREDICTED: uncharacterized protein LOC109345623 isoform X1 [Lupinus angustifolius]